MATKLLERSGKKMITYLPSMRALLHYLKGVEFGRGAAVAALSTAASKYQATYDLKHPHTTQSLAAHWPSNPHFPLPGGTAIDYTQFAETEGAMDEDAKKERKTLVDAFLEVGSEDNRKRAVLSQFLDETSLDNEDCMKQVEKPNIDINREQFECVIQECPEFLKNSFIELFPASNLKESPLTIITFSQKTKNDMTAWSEEVEGEREGLLDVFIESAKQVCCHLSTAGYWADFIDPSSGQAYYSNRSNNTFWETDERYNHLGFQIEDLGCCKVIRHKLWGSHVFVGAIFTNASSDSNIFKYLLNSR